MLKLTQGRGAEKVIEGSLVWNFAAKLLGRYGMHATPRTLDLLIVPLPKLAEAD